MEWLMRYLFWVILVVVLVGAGGFWAFTVPPLEQDTGRVQQAVQDESKKVLGMAKDSIKIPTERHVLETKKYGEYLKEQEEKIKALLRDKRTVLDTKFANAPKAPLEFDGWLMNVRKEILEEAAKAGMALPANFAVQWLDEGKTTSSLADREPRLNKIALAADVVHLLAQAKAAVTVTKFPGEPDKPEATEEVKMGVLSLDHLEQLPPERVVARDRDALRLAYESAGAALGEVKSAKPDPAFSAAAIDIRFTAPLSVVPVVAQALESNPHWFAIIRKLDTQRIAEPYPKATDMGIAAPGGPTPPAAAAGAGAPAPAPAPAATPAPGPAPAPAATPGGTTPPAATLTPEEIAKRAMLNTRYHEAPVQAVVLLDTLNFKPEALK